MPNPRSKAYPSMCRGGLHTGFNALYASDLFKLKPEQLGLFLDNSRTLHLNAGTVLHGPDDLSKRLYIVRKGRIILYKLDANGKRLIKRHLTPPSVFGIVTLLGQTVCTAFAEAAEDSEVSVLNRENVLALLEARPNVALRLLEIMSKRLVVFQELVDEGFQEASYCPVRIRLAHFLLMNIDAKSPVLDDVSHEEIGDMIGAVRQTVTTALNAMRKEGLIQTGQRKIRIIDPARLEEFVRTTNSGRLILD